MAYVITRRERNKCGYFTVAWSPITLADKYSIVTKVPAMGGVIELYFMDDQGKLNLFCLSRSWYGGLRSTLRERTDPLLEEDPVRKAILESHEKKLYYRYSLSESHPDMLDVVYFLSETAAPGQNLAPHSGRFEQIFLKEIDEGKLVTI